MKNVLHFVFIENKDNHKINLLTFTYVFVSFIDHATYIYDPLFMFM